MFTVSSPCCQSGSPPFALLPVPLPTLEHHVCLEFSMYRFISVGESDTRFNKMLAIRGTELPCLLSFLGDFIVLLLC